MVTMNELMKRKTFQIKFVELALAIISAGLVTHGVNVGGGNLDKTATVYVTLMGFIMVNLVAIASLLLRTPLHNSLMVAIAAAGSLMFLTSGALMLDLYISYLDQYGVRLPGTGRLLAASITSLITAAVYGDDIFITYREGLLLSLLPATQTEEKKSEQS